MKNKCTTKAITASNADNIQHVTIRNASVVTPKRGRPIRGATFEDERGHIKNVRREKQGTAEKLKKAIRFIDENGHDKVLPGSPHAANRKKALRKYTGGVLKIPPVLRGFEPVKIESGLKICAKRFIVVTCPPPAEVV